MLVRAAHILPSTQQIFAPRRDFVRRGLRATHLPLFSPSPKAILYTGIPLRFSFRSLPLRPSVSRPLGISKTWFGF